jgi:microsomal dipeptidase-like Zn-dependent dipeptidase
VSWAEGDPSLRDEGLGHPRGDDRIGPPQSCAQFDESLSQNLTVTLARRGFTEEELRKFLGLNYLRLVREVVG